MSDQLLREMTKNHAKALEAKDKRIAELDRNCTGLFDEARRLQTDNERLTGQRDRLGIEYDEAQKEIERLTAERNAAEIIANKLHARVDALEGALDKACESIETQPKVGSSIDYANGFHRGVLSQRMRAFVARDAAQEGEGE